jgi:signal transduction histidine kinase
VNEDLARQLGEIRPGEHVCLIYDTPADQAAVIGPFIRDGLARGERCLYVADDLSLASVRQIALAAGVDVDAESARGALRLLGRRDAYHRTGEFAPSAMVEFLLDAAAGAARDGFSGFRYAGEMTWALGAERGNDALIPYEAWLDDPIRNARMTVLCQYSRQRFPPSVIREVLRTHPIVITGGAVCPNLYFEPPDFVRGGASDEARVDWMLRQLRGGRERDEALRLLAVENAQLYRQERRRRGQLEAVRIVAGAMTRELDLTALLRFIVREAATLVGDAAAMVFLVDGAGTMLTPYAGHRIPRSETEPVGTRPLRVGEGVTGTVAATRKGMIVNDFRTAGLAPPSLLARSTVAAALSVPIAFQERLVGVVTLWRLVGEPAFVHEDLELIELFADAAAIAIQNARLYEERGRNERQLHDLVARLLVSQEEERRRIAYDVHDGLAQAAAGAHRHLQTFAQYHRPRSPRTQRELGLALELAQQTVGEARRLVAGLRPAALDDLGLAAATRLEAEALGAEGWTVTYQESLGARRLAPTVETALFRITQEALANVRKHTSPGRVLVTLSRRAGRVRLAIRDWGTGFDPAVCPDRTRPNDHVGLASIEERVKLLGGRWTLHTRRGVGTRIVVDVSVAAETPDGRTDGAEGPASHPPQPAAAGAHPDR